LTEQPSSPFLVLSILLILSAFLLGHCPPGLEQETIGRLVVGAFGEAGPFESLFELGVQIEPPGVELLPR
jgi:hypothetical protein